MAKASKDDETKLDLDEATLAGVVKKMLATPPTPHKPKAVKPTGKVVRKQKPSGA